MRETRKVGRAQRDRKKRKAPKEKVKPARRIVRGEPPKKHKKVVATQELVRNPRTGKMEYKDVYKVSEVRDPKRDKKLEKTLYIPKVAPEKERRYLKYVPPQFRDATKRYDNPDKYGDLSLYKKSRLMQIAKDKYDLTDKLAKHLDKDDVIKYIKKRYKKADTFSDKDYLPKTIKLAKVEPVRPRKVVYIPSEDPENPLDGTLSYGKLQYKGKLKGTMTPFETLNMELDKRQNFKKVPRFGTKRKMNPKVYADLKKGNIDPDVLIAELVTHLDLPDDEKANLHRLTEKQAISLYKKAYKLNLKGDDVKFEKSIKFPKIQYQPNGGNFAQAPRFIDEIGKPHVFSKNVRPPPSITLFEPFNYDPKGKEKE
jgi:hypothetical protein